MYSKWSIPNQNLRTLKLALLQCRELWILIDLCPFNHLKINRIKANQSCLFPKERTHSKVERKLCKFKKVQKHYITVIREKVGANLKNLINVKIVKKAYQNQVSLLIIRNQKMIPRLMKNMESNLEVHLVINWTQTLLN